VVVGVDVGGRDDRHATKSTGYVVEHSE
jgi:hypothetical protein